MVMQRKLRALSVIGVTGLLFVPVVIDRDSYPLATYPMYARTRSAEVSFVTAQGVRSDGEIVRLSLAEIGASDDPLVVAGELRAAVRRGEAQARCAAIASRVDDDRIEQIELVTERHNTLIALDGGDSLLNRRVHASCPVVG